MKRKLSLLALALNFFGSILLFFALQVQPAETTGGSVHILGMPAAMVSAKHPSFLPLGWCLLIFGFATQFGLEFKQYK
ncbi:MAG: hypothetical protein AB1515_04680 [Nitrospirota bacterium]